MKKSDLKVIMGGPAGLIGKTPKKFISAFVTNSRLMGVLVLYMHWKLESEDNPMSLHQFFYVETTEAGIETYTSIYGNDQKTLVDIEQSLTGGLGGEKVGINEREACILLQKYAEMTERFGKPLPDRVDEYDFMLKEKIEYDLEEERKLFGKTCVKIVSAEQLINYFLMRYISADHTASDFLSYKPLDRDIVENSKSQMLCFNKIESRIDDNGNLSYMCESLLEDSMNYRILVSEIRLADKLVASFEKISEFAITPTEAAMKLARSEFITIFEIMDDREAVIEMLNQMYPTALQKRTDMGNVYMMFKNNNNHVKEPLYRLNDDVKGIVYVTDEDQLVLASYTIAQIHRLENEMQYSGFGSMVIALAKYEFKESIFYDFMQSNTGDFLHYMEYVSDYDPDSD